MFYDKQELEGGQLICKKMETIEKYNTKTLPDNHTAIEVAHWDIGNQLSTPCNVDTDKVNIVQVNGASITSHNHQEKSLTEKEIAERLTTILTNVKYDRPIIAQPTKTYDDNEKEQTSESDTRQNKNNDKNATSLNDGNATTSLLPRMPHDDEDNDQQPINDQTNLSIDQSNNEEIQSEENQVQTNENTVIEQMATSTTITHCENNAEAEDHTQLESNQPNQPETEINTDNDEQAIRTTAGQQPNQLRRIARGIISTARQHPIAVATGICVLTVGICAGAFGIEPAVASASNQLQRILALFTA